MPVTSCDVAVLASEVFPLAVLLKDWSPRQYLWLSPTGKLSYEKVMGVNSKLLAPPNFQYLFHVKNCGVASFELISPTASRLY